MIFICSVDPQLLLIPPFFEYTVTISKLSESLKRFIMSTVQSSPVTGISTLQMDQSKVVAYEDLEKGISEGKQGGVSPIQAPSESDGLSKATADSPTTASEAIPDGGLVAWLQVLGCFFLWFNSWYVLWPFAREL